MPSIIEHGTDLTLAETAFLSAVRTGAVEKAIENGILDARTVAGAGRSGSRRRLPFASVAYFSAIERAGLTNLETRLKHELWRKLCNEVAHGLRPLPCIEFAPATTIDLERLVSEPVEAAERYVSARAAHIVIDPDIKGGMPVIRGTRMTAHSVLGRVDGGDTIEMILDENPHVTREALEAAVIYAHTHPLRGRPRGRSRVQSAPKATAAA